jgi:uncharacterized membrane protein YphA (DoxX/SURF4 family)
MRAKERIALAVPPLLLRLFLGVTLLWLGMAKIQGQTAVKGEDAAVLANLGVIRPAGAQPGIVPAPPPAATPAPGKPAEEKPLAPTEPLPPSKGSGSGGGGGGGNAAGEPFIDDEPEYQLVFAQSTAPPVTGPMTYHAEDFPEPVRVRALHSMTLSILRAADPRPRADATRPEPLLPTALAKGTWPVALAWTAAVIELAGGVMLLVGLFTRLWALGVVCVMAGAIWITHLGPAIQAGDARLGFLPNHDMFDMPAWAMLLWHFALLMTALALLFSGPGALSLDRAVFRSAEEDDAGDKP